MQEHILNAAQSNLSHQSHYKISIKTIKMMKNYFRRESTIPQLTRKKNLIYKSNIMSSEKKLKNKLMKIFKFNRSQ